MMTFRKAETFSLRAKRVSRYNVNSKYFKITGMNIEEIRKFLEDHKEISERHNEEIKKNEVTGFNVFQLISAIYHRENLHTDILHFLLNHKEKDNQENKYLDLFLEYLSKAYKLDINLDNYKECKVRKEDPTYDTETNKRGRIDILIKGMTSSIIIENKINNAGDTPNQLIKYIKQSGGIDKVDAIIYLSMDGKKNPDQNWIVDKEDKIKILKKIINVAAFVQDNSSQDLTHGWLKDCIENTQDNEEMKFVLKHYLELLKILDKTMNALTKPQKQFYEEIIKNDDEKYKVALIIKNLLSNGLSIFLAEKFLVAFDNKKYAPFDKPRIEAGSQIIFDCWKFSKSGSNYYLRIWFKEEYQQFLIELIDRTGKWLEDDLISIKKALERYEFKGQLWRWYSFQEKDDLPQIIENLINDLNKINSKSV